jgi:hypothetical protein
MTRLRTASLLAACLTAAGLAAAGTAAAGTAAASPAAAAPLGGINVAGIDNNTTAAQIDGTVAAAHTLHARVVRSDVPWSVLEPRAQGALEPRALALADRLVSDAAAAGMKVIMTTESTPCWGSSAPATLLRACTPGRPSQANAWPPREAAAFGKFTAFLAQRYGTKLAAIEIWNEPDQANQLYLAGPNKAQAYAAILRAAYPAIKQVAPTLPVLGGAFVGSNGAFLRALYAAGIKGYYNGLAVHFYTLTLGALRAIHQVQLANGDNTPLWLDEFGWSSCWPAQRTQQEQGCVTPQVQATNLTNLFRSIARTPYVATAVVYKLQSSFREDFGVLSAAGARKPAFGALASVLAAPLTGRPTPVTLRLRTRAGHVIASGEGPVGDYMALEAFHGTTLRYRALFTLDRFNRYTLTLPAVLGTHGLRVRVFQYWQGVRAGAVRSL